jgi:hypothetical protein
MWWPRSPPVAGRRQIVATPGRGCCPTVPSRGAALEFRHLDVNVHVVNAAFLPFVSLERPYLTFRRNSRGAAKEHSHGRKAVVRSFLPRQAASRRKNRSPLCGSYGAGYSHHGLAAVATFFRRCAAKMASDQRCKCLNSRPRPSSVATLYRRDAAGNY